MLRPFALPDLGEGIHEGEVVAVLVSEGDQVPEGQPILQIETDKACVDIPSPFSGSVQEIKVKANDVVKVGTVLMVFSDGQQRQKPHQEEGAAVSTAPRTEQAAATSGETVPFMRREGGPVPAAPSTRRLARELGVELREVRPSGPAGLVTADDVRSHAATAGSAATAGAETTAVPAESLNGKEPKHTGERAATSEETAAPPLPDFGRWGPVDRQPLRSVRRATAAHMALAWAQIPHVNHQDVADITDLEHYRRSLSSEVEAAGGKLTLTVLALKAVVAALKEHPRFNASLDLVSQEVVLKRYHHIGVAVDTDRGLMVPVVRDVDRKSVLELSIELKVMAERARATATPLEEMQGGSFTLTNIGALGGTGFAPIINYPEVAILGMGKAKLQPVVQGTESDYQIVPRLMMPLVLAFDHRVLDGADAARFMKTLVDCLETPAKLWLRM